MKKVVRISKYNVEIQKRKKQKRIYLRVKPPKGQVVVTAPYRLSINAIEKFVLENMDFIEKNIEDIRKRNLEINEKNKMWLWGEKYPLRIAFSKSKDKVIFDGREIILNMPRGEATDDIKNNLDSQRKVNTSLEKIEKLINKFYKNEMEKVIFKIATEYENKFGEKVSEIRIRNMKTKWGTCNIKNRRIWLNLNLCKLPKECIEYVVVHEIAHLKEKNHNKRFYNIIDEIYPKRKEAEKMLKRAENVYI